VSTAAVVRPRGVFGLHGRPEGLHRFDPGLRGPLGRGRLSDGRGRLLVRRGCGLVRRERLAVETAVLCVRRLAALVRLLELPTVRRLLAPVVRLLGAAGPVPCRLVPNVLAGRGGEVEALEEGGVPARGV